VSLKDGRLKMLLRRRWPGLGGSRNIGSSKKRLNDIHASLAIKFSVKQHSLRLVHKKAHKCESSFIRNPRLN
jgi:hypothetical protein